MHGFLRGLDAFAAQLTLLEREPEQIDVCEAQAAEAALFGDDPDGDEEESEDEGEQRPAAIAESSH